MADITSAESYQYATEAAQLISSALPKTLSHPTVAIICGSGLGGLQTTIEPEPSYEVLYEDIPHFPQSTVKGHEGKMVFGLMGKEERVPVVLLVGRAHYYEGHTMELVTFATRVCKLLGVEIILVTNAAGGLNPSFNVGDIALVMDHINLAGLVGINPLRGANASEFGERFPSLSDAYDLALRRSAHRAWHALGYSSESTKQTLREGVYAFVGGPSFETRTEVAMLRLLGADLVGMSTVPEVITARHSGMRVLAFSLVTNKAVVELPPRGDAKEVQGLSDEECVEYMSRGKANHEEVIREGKEAAEVMQAFVKRIVTDLKRT